MPRTVHPDFERPASVLGQNIPIGIPVIDDSGRKTAMVIVVHIEFDSEGNQRVTFSDETRRRVKALGTEYEDSIFRYLSGVAKATHNTACKLARERWPNISR